MTSDAADYAARWGYTPGLTAKELPPLVRATLRATREAVLGAWEARRRHPIAQAGGTESGLTG